jgi:hypothetical protein
MTGETCRLGKGSGTSNLPFGREPDLGDAGKLVTSKRDAKFPDDLQSDVRHRRFDPAYVDPIDLGASCANCS